MPGRGLRQREVTVLVTGGHVPRHGSKTEEGATQPDAGPPANPDPGPVSPYPFVDTAPLTLSAGGSGKCWSPRGFVESPRRGTARALPPGHASWMLWAGDVPASPARADGALRADADRRCQLSGVRAAGPHLG